MWSAYPWTAWWDENVLDRVGSKLLVHECDFSLTESAHMNWMEKHGHMARGNLTRLVRVGSSHATCVYQLLVVCQP